MLDLIVVDDVVRGIVVRDLVTGKSQACLADAVVLATGGYANAFFLSTNAKGCNTTATWRAHRKELSLPTLVLRKFTQLASRQRRLSVETDPNE